jgi:hypothetical protein
MVLIIAVTYIFFNSLFKEESNKEYISDEGTFEKVIRFNGCTKKTHFIGKLNPLKYHTYQSFVYHDVHLNTTFTS